MKLTDALALDPTRPRGCTCEMVETTTFGDSVRTYMPVPDENCPAHHPNLGYPSLGDIAGKKIDVAILDEERVSIPEVECVRCGNVMPLKTSSWHEHDPRSVGWWCQPCRVAAGFDRLPTSHMVVVSTPYRGDVDDFYRIARQHAMEARGRDATHGGWWSEG